MEGAWTRERLAAFQELKPELLDIFRLQPIDAAIWLSVRQYITDTAVEHVQQERMTATEKAFALLKHLGGQDNGWSGLNAFLDKQCHLAIKQRLLDAEVRLLSYDANEFSGHVIKQKSDNDGSATFTKCLQDWTLNECETISELWGKRLHTRGLAHAFVRLDFAEEITRTPFKADELDHYEFLFGPEKRIVISGDPGMGKSTLINKIAYDWATNSNKKLSNRFQYVFILRCGRLTQQMTLESELQEILGTDYEGAINTCFSEQKSKILLMLDGFDERSGSDHTHWLDELINNRRHVHVKCVITTRPSHVDSIARKHLWLCVQGFGSNEQKEFLQRQLVAENDAKFILDKFDSLPTLTQRPFFLTIVCVLARHWQQDGQDFKPSAASALFELMKAYHDLLFYTHNHEKKFDINREEFDDALVQAGRFAYSQVFAQQCKDATSLPDIEITPLTDQEKKRVTKVGLLSVERRTTSSGTPGIPNHVFLHQLFAEYVCAVFLAQLLERQSIESKNLTCYLNLTESPVSYFLSALSRDYLTAAVSAALDEDHGSFLVRDIPRLRDLPDVGYTGIMLETAFDIHFPWVADCYDLDSGKLALKLNEFAIIRHLTCSCRVVSSKLLRQLLSFMKGKGPEHLHIDKGSMDEPWDEPWMRGVELEAFEA